LRNAAGQRRAFSDKDTFFICFNRDAEFHVTSVAIGGRLAMRC
jgi:hypothetical protein